MNAARPAVTGGAPTARLRLALLLLERLHKELTRAIDRVLVHEELALAEWLIVSELASGDAPLTHIARRLARDPGSLSRATTRLIKRGLLDSARHERDRRRATLSLTASGRALHDRVAASVDIAARREAGPRGMPLDRLLFLLDIAGGGAPASPSPQWHDDHALSLENDS